MIFTGIHINIILEVSCQRLEGWTVIAVGWVDFVGQKLFGVSRTGRVVEESFHTPGRLPYRWVDHSPDLHDRVWVIQIPIQVFCDLQGLAFLLPKQYLYFLQWIDHRLASLELVHHAR